MSNENLNMEDALTSLLGNMANPNQGVTQLVKRPVVDKEMQACIDQNIYGLLSKKELTDKEVNLLAILVPARSKTY